MCPSFYFQIGFKLSKVMFREETYLATFGASQNILSYKQFRITSLQIPTRCKSVSSKKTTPQGTKNQQNLSTLLIS